MPSFLGLRLSKFYEKVKSKKGVSKKGEKVVSSKRPIDRSKGNNRRFRPHIVF